MDRDLWLAVGAILLVCGSIVTFAVIFALVLKKRWSVQQIDPGPERENLEKESMETWLYIQRMERETAEERLRAQRARRKTVETEAEIESLRLRLLASGVDRGDRPSRTQERGE